MTAQELDAILAWEMARLEAGLVAGQMTQDEYEADADALHEWAECQYQRDEP